MKLILVLENDTDQKPDKSRIFVHHRGRRQMIDFFSYSLELLISLDCILLHFALGKKSIISRKRKQSNVQIISEHQE